MRLRSAGHRTAQGREFAPSAAPQRCRERKQPVRSDGLLRAYQYNALAQDAVFDLTIVSFNSVGYCFE